MSSSKTALWIGTRLRDERARLGLSQKELATRARVSQPAVTLWEKGQRTPGIDELLKLSGALGVPVSALLPPEDRQPIRAVLRAESIELDQGGLAAELEEVIKAAEEMAVPEAELAVDATDPHTAAELLLGGAGIEKPPVDVEGLAHRCGVRIVRHHLPEALSGAIIELDDGPVITVNEGQSNGRKRFSVAHELGHHLLRHHDRFHIDISEPAAVGEPPGYNWLHERQANEFAAALLMPAAMVRRSVQKHRSVRALADKFDVSPMAMSYRLQTLDIGLS